VKATSYKLRLKSRNVGEIEQALDVIIMSASHKNVSRAALVPMIALMRDNGMSDHVRGRCARAIGWMAKAECSGVEAVSPLNALLKDGSPYLRGEAATAILALAEVGTTDRSSIPLLQQALKDENEEVRHQAKWALAFFKDADKEAAEVSIPPKATDRGGRSSIGTGGLSSNPNATSEASMGDLAAYREARLLGSGGFSTVYKVRRGTEECALKVPGGFSLGDMKKTVYLRPEDHERYLKEAEIWRRLTEQTPSAVIRLIDTGVEPFPWFSMELGEGNLAELSFDIDREDRTALMVDLLGKLDSIHRQGVVHKDIKPENILRVKDNWKFSDFGLSIIVGASSHHSVGMSAGTWRYKAPEQVSRKLGHIDAVTDVWQMGVLAFELLTDRSPFSATDPASISLEIINEEVDLSPLPLDFQGVIEKALMKKKKERWQTAQEFGLALDEVRKKVDTRGR
jgi:hypothetical protein